MRSRAGFLAGVLVVAGLLSGVTASSVAAATSTTVKWRVSSMTAGQNEWLSDLASTNSPGVKTWSKKGSCTLTPKSKPTQLTMGTGGSCTLTLEIAESGRYPWEWSTQAISLASACAVGGVCAVGDTGPGGGIVFYVANGTFTQRGASRSMCTTACKYLEAAPTNWLPTSNSKGDPSRSWATGPNQLISASGAKNDRIGDGYRNSVAIVNQVGNVANTSAAVLARSYNGGGRSDWFLPSQAELKQLYFKRYAVGSDWEWDYWSSSEADDDSAWVLGFSDALQYRSTKTQNRSYRVRPVRAF